MLLSHFLASCGDCRSGLALLERKSYRGTVACCGAFALHDVAVAERDDLQIDIANAPGTGGQTAAAVVWLTMPSCDRLFEGRYPSTESGVPATPICRAIIGPVSFGQVSSRIKLAPGQYRAFVQAWSTNGGPAQYDVDVGIWGQRCGPVVPGR